MLPACGCFDSATGHRTHILSPQPFRAAQRPARDITKLHGPSTAHSELDTHPYMQYLHTHAMSHGLEKLVLAKVHACMYSTTPSDACGLPQDKLVISSFSPLGSRARIRSVTTLNFGHP